MDSEYDESEESLTEEKTSRRPEGGRRSAWLVPYAVVAMAVACVVVVVFMKPMQSLRRVQTVLGIRRRPMDVRGKSWYFVLVDRFALSPGENVTLNTCQGELNDWCNGTIKGITSKLEYIQEMGFDCLWITPVLYQYPHTDGPSGKAIYGYWAYRWFEIDPHFGTEQDLKDLAHELHQRGMCLVYDIVLNHVGPIHSVEDVAQIDPFNDTAYYNTLNIGDMSFDEYTKRNSGWPPPAQAMGPGAMCKGPSCTNYRCTLMLPKPGLYAKVPDPRTCTFLGPLAAGPKDIRQCGVGDFLCPGYNETVTELGWFYDLGDLNHSVSFVRDKLKEWLRHMVESYDIDGIRLDTAPFVGKEYLREYQEAAGVPIFGEVTTTNISYHSSFQKEGLLDAVLNFPTYYVAGPAYCGGPFWPFSVFNLTRLGFDMMVQQAEGVYKDPDMLGNFIDNHDTLRAASYCSDDSRYTNALAWVMFARGVPIVYYGSEERVMQTKQPLWKHGYNTSSTFFRAIQRMNAIRKERQLGMSLSSIIHNCEDMLVFTRGGVEGTWIFTNNREWTDKEVEYPVAPAALPNGQVWVNVMKQPSELAVIREGKLIANGSMPHVLVAVANSTMQLAQ